MALRPQKQLLRDAYMTVSDGYSPDRVIADPVMNAHFLKECERLGSALEPIELNFGLLNLRKAGSLRGLKSRITKFEDLTDYIFAAEIAVRILERGKGLSLDAIICDPKTACEFDQLARDLAPGFDPLRYRWAALHLRKSRRLQPELVAHAAPPEKVELLRVRDIHLDMISAGQGIYLFHTRTETLYIGEATNLRNRIAKHLEHSDNRFLARWIWESGTDDVFLELQFLSGRTTTRVRRALESELIASRCPVFNVRN